MQDDQREVNPIYSTIGEIESFQASLPWNDIVNQLGRWEQAIKNERSQLLDEVKERNLSSAAFGVRSGEIDGRLRTIEFVRKLPDILISFLEERKNDSRRKQAE